MLSSALDYALDHSTDSEVPEPCLGAGHVVEILPILNKHVHSEPCYSIHAHESCMHVAVRVLHSSAFIAFCTHAALHVSVGVGHCMNVAVNIN